MTNDSAASGLTDAIKENDDRVAEVDLPKALWAHDLSVWKGRDEAALKSISTRLGWLHTPEDFLAKASELTDFASEIKSAGFTHVAVLGMGGSSLCVEVLRDVLGVKPGYPELHVLDSTHPDQILALEAKLDLPQTLFVVSSKSGSTLEPNCYQEYFWKRVQDVTKSKPGAQFVAITDEGSDLAKLGAKEGFRKVFVNPSDIGGRFSVLSYFGLVPAALMGVDVRELLERAKLEADQSKALGSSNSSLKFGTEFAAAAQLGRNKLTIVASEPLKSFGYWAEQLIAESTGKLGKGILPVEGEGKLPYAAYGDDRLFVAMQLRGYDVALAELSGPCVEQRLIDVYDIGAHFFRWEFATAVAGWLLEINPFDEPNVAESKANTNTVLAGKTQSQSSGLIRTFFRDDATKVAEELHAFCSANLHAGDYLAIMAYVERTDESIALLDLFRTKIEERYRVAVTVGFGPRFLHSTGQFHKGGPKIGVYLQITDTPKHDVAIPTKPFSFGTLIAAQAEGDRESLLSKGKPLMQLVLDTKVVEELRAIGKAL